MTKPAAPRANRDLNRDVSRALAALFKDATGRGPTHTRTYIEDNLVVTVLHDTMTQTERTLKEDHREGAIRDLRRMFQGTLKDDAVEAVETLTGRKVLAFLSDHAVDPDYSVEAFVLEPGFGNDED